MFLNKDRRLSHSIWVRWSGHCSWHIKAADDIPGRVRVADTVPQCCPVRRPLLTQAESY